MGIMIMMTRNFTDVKSWQNFQLGDELDISGIFIYNGLEAFRRIKSLNNSVEIFEVLYNLSVGIERVCKVAIALLECDDNTDHKEFEKSLKTHNSNYLLKKINNYSSLKLTPAQNSLIQLLDEFYKSYRYNRFNVDSISNLDRESNSFIKLLREYLEIKIDSNICNEEKFITFLYETVLGISKNLYKIINESARNRGICTQELSYDSKAAQVFYNCKKIIKQTYNHDILIKELLIYFMNTKDTNKYFSSLREMKPLNFDVANIDDYIRSFIDFRTRVQVYDEMEELHNEYDEDKYNERIEILNYFGGNVLSFDEDDADM